MTPLELFADKLDGMVATLRLAARGKGAVELEMETRCITLEIVAEMARSASSHTEPPRRPTPPAPPPPPPNVFITEGTQRVVRKDSSHA